MIAVLLVRRSILDMDGELDRTLNDQAFYAVYPSLYLHQEEEFAFLYVNKKQNNTGGDGLDARNTQFSMYLFGPLAIFGPGGENLTPRGQKSKAILALLAVSDRGIRSRSWICDKLWSDRAPEQAYASLRQALVEIRKSLGGYCADLLTIDKFNIELHRAKITIDVAQLRENLTSGVIRLDGSTTLRSDFLEGIDVRDAEFEEWLSVERSHWADALDDFDYQEPVGPTSDSGSQAALDMQEPEAKPEPIVPAIAIMPPTIMSADTGARQLASVLTNVFVQLVQDHEQVEILDFRSSADASTVEQNLYGHGTARIGLLHFCVRISRSGRRLRAELALVEVVSGRIEWMTTIDSDDNRVEPARNPHVLSQLNFATDSAIKSVQNTLARSNVQPAKMANLLILRSIDKIFDIDQQRLVDAESDIKASLELLKSPQAYAWLAFISTFRMGQNYSDFGKDQLEQLEFLARKALELDPNNSLSNALCAHVFSYGLRNYGAATDLFVRSLKLNPNRALTWDLFSVLHAYIGKPEVGLKCAEWARNIGQFSPLSFYFDTSCCITASLAGHHEAAVRYGQKAIDCRPAYNPALRFMLSSYGHLGDQPNAEGCKRKLLSIEPDFAISSYLEAPYPSIHSDQRDDFLRGLELAGVPASPG